MWGEVGRTPDRALEQGTDPVLQDLVGREPDGILNPIRFQIMVDVGIGKTSIGTEIELRDPATIAGHDRVKHHPPAIRAVNVTRTQSAAFEVAELVEHEQRMIAGAFEVAVPDT